MKRKKLTACMMMIVLVLCLSMTAFAATNKKQAILDEMTAAATDLGVQNSVTFQNAYTSVANYEGVITDEQYQAALDEIAVIKNAIASKGVDAIRNDPSLMDELAAHVIAAAEAVGVTINYEGSGIGEVVSNGQDITGGQTPSQPVSNPIKQTGADYTATIIMTAAIAAVFGGCVFAAKKKKLFA